MTARTALITGAGGFVGGALTTGLAGLGWDVVAVDRDFTGRESVAGVRRIECDLGGVGERRGPAFPIGAASPAAAEAHVVIHGAWTTADPGSLGVTEDQYVELNLRPLMAMIEAARGRPPGAFVFVSSSGVFSATDGAGGLSDACEPTGSSSYAQAKRMGERLVRTELSAVCPVLVVRLGYLYGPGESRRDSRPGLSLVAQWLEAARSGEPLPVREDDPEREWTFAPDLAPVLSRILGGSRLRDEGSPLGTARPPIHLGSRHVIRDGALAEMIAGHFPGVAVTAAPAGPAVKPPMIASDLPEIRDFPWTHPAAGLEALLGMVPAS